MFSFPLHFQIEIEYDNTIRTRQLDVPKNLIKYNYNHQQQSTTNHSMWACDAQRLKDRTGYWMGNVTGTVAAKFAFFPPEPPTYKVSKGEDGKVVFSGLTCTDNNMDVHLFQFEIHSYVDFFFLKSILMLKFGDRVSIFLLSKGSF